MDQPDEQDSQTVNVNIWINEIENAVHMMRQALHAQRLANVVSEVQSDQNGRFFVDEKPDTDEEPDAEDAEPENKFYDKEVNFTLRRIAFALERLAQREEWLVERDAMARRDDRYRTLLLRELVRCVATTNGNFSRVDKALDEYETMIYTQPLPKYDASKEAF